MTIHVSKTIPEHRYKHTVTIQTSLQSSIFHTDVELFPFSLNSVTAMQPTSPPRVAPFPFQLLKLLKRI